MITSMNEHYLEWQNRALKAEALLREVIKEENYMKPKGPGGQDKYAGKPNLCRMIDSHFEEMGVKK